jgi:hypothetical protein
LVIILQLHPVFDWRDNIKKGCKRQTAGFVCGANLYKEDYLLSILLASFAGEKWERRALR